MYYSTVALFCQLSYTIIVQGIDVKVVKQQTVLVPTPAVLVTSLLLTIEPGDFGLPVHKHSGPVVGYVFEGEFLHQVNDEIPQIISAGNIYHQKYPSNHVWSANASNETTCKVIAIIYGRIGEDATIFVENYKRESYSEALSKAKLIK